MIKYVVLLRGVNVSGQKKVPMAELRSLFYALSFENVQTYIQSGNVVFQSSEKDKSILETNIGNAIHKHFKFEVPVLIKTKLELKKIFDMCPFLDEKKEKSYFTLLHKNPEIEFAEALSTINIDNEEIIVTKDCVYFFSEKGYGKAKCNNNFIERKLKINATTRNYKTIEKLLKPF